MQPRAPTPARANGMVWAYAYRIVPPRSEALLGSLKAFLLTQRPDAQLSGRTWEARLVVEQQLTHILIVSDSPELDLDANRKLEAELRKLNAGFTVTLPLAVGDVASGDLPTPE